MVSKDEQATYYDAGGIETLEVVRAKLTPEQYVGFLLGTSLVYQCRLNWKGQPADDARKSANYAVWLAEELQRAQRSPMRVVELIAAERREQIEKHGFDAAHDDGPDHDRGQLIDAAVYLLTGVGYPSSWSDEHKRKFDRKSGLERLVVAAALIAAEYDRRVRKQAREAAGC
ncbi:hypothetical protein DPPLL_30830 [Desulfofustis limnaeus]|uniref:DUF3310 domain-containing protein n=2 Tax=Desulfofustis limnaeus TaxID=2740163 RepID=A0ABM7WCN1_9BACT|nr:hypothetical protein DPPLL_30830 [Desulfofustis limnaeus]